MDWIDDRDPFESIVREFFGEGRQRKRAAVRSEEDDRSIDWIETKKNVFLIVELPGFSDEDVSIKVTDSTIDILARKRKLEGVHDYLQEKLDKGVHIKRELPRMANGKKHQHSVRNGILEVQFDKR